MVIILALTFVKIEKITDIDLWVSISDGRLALKGDFFNMNYIGQKDLL